MGDLFALEGTRPGYDPSAIYLESSDKKGHGQVIRTKVPPEIAGKIAEIVASREFPFRTQQDFIRNALVHACNQLPTNDEDFRSAAGLMTARATIETALEIDRMRKSVIDSCRKLANSAQTEAEKTEARQCLIMSAKDLNPDTQKVIYSLLDRL